MDIIVNKRIEKIAQLITIGKFKEALNSIKETSNLKNCDKVCQINCLILKSGIVCYFGKYKEAINIAEKAEKESVKIGNYELIIKARTKSIRGIYFLGDVKKSLSLLDEILKLMEEKNLLEEPSFIETKIEAIGFKGLILANQGNYKEGFELIKQSVDQARQFELKHHLTYFTIHYGLYKLFSGNLEEAEKFIFEGNELAEELGNKHTIAIGKMRLGVLKARTFEFNEAIALYNQSIELLEELDSTYLFFAIYMNLGEVYKAIYKFDKAIECYEKSLAYESGFKFMTNTNLAEIYYWKNDLDVSLEKYLKALKQSILINDRRYHPLILYNIINIFVQKQQFTEANEYLEQLRKIGKEEQLKQYEDFYTISAIQYYKASSKVQDWSIVINYAENFLKMDDCPTEWRVDLLYSILEIRLRELQINATEENLDAVRKQIDEVMFEAEDKQFHNLIVNIYRLKAQLALVELDVKKAIELYITARTLAENKGLDLLVQEIAAEQEKLESQLAVWSKYKNQNLPIDETLKHVTLETTAEAIAKKTSMEVRENKTGKIIEYRKLFSIKI